MLTGNVLWWSERDKNGVLVDSQGNEYYFDISVLIDKNASFEHNQSVSFSRNEKITNIRCAKNVK